MKYTLSFFLKALTISSFLSFSFFAHTAERKRIRQEDAPENLPSFSYNEKTKIFTCTICQLEKAKRDHMVTHTYVHITERSHVCNHINKNGIRCTEAFKRPDGASRHRREVHGEIKQYPCHLCDKMFKRAQHLDNHLATHNKNRTAKRKKNSSSTDEDSDDDTITHDGSDDDEEDDDNDTVTNASSEDPQEQRYDGQTCAVSEKGSPQKNRSPLKTLEAAMPSCASLQKRFAILASAVTSSCQPTVPATLPTLEESEPKSPYLSLARIEEILFSDE